MAKKPQVNKKSASSPKSRSAGDSLLGLSLESWVASAADAAPKDGSLRGRLVVVGKRAQAETAIKALVADSWQLQRCRSQIERGDEIFALVTAQGPAWVVSPSEKNKSEAHYNLLTWSALARVRDLVGALVATWENYPQLAIVEVSFVDCDDNHKFGAVVGLELGAYSFKLMRKITVSRTLPAVKVIGVSDKIMRQAGHTGVATNIARHLANLPPAELQPQSYAHAVRELFANESTVTVDVWGPEKLRAERMGLLLAVGAGAVHGPHMVRMSYRPNKIDRAARWIFVGKGVTFDSGGLDIKPASGMRHMKKDMAGSAAVVGLLWSLVKNSVPVACDFYLALAENAVDAASFHPGDIITSRSGISVEIHNTDAEGRLVMADVMSVALESSDPKVCRGMIDVATLTGAIKVGLGADIPGLFANDDQIADALLTAGQAQGERLWRMPLVDEYAKDLASNAADISNAGNSGYGGAITAALFLKRFTQNRPWAHLDIYGWTDAPQGPYREMGATGQGVQLLTKFVIDSAERGSSSPGPQVRR